MSVAIPFPLEFIVLGTPVSLQAKRRASLAEWKSRVKAASRASLPQGHFATRNPLAVTLLYFPGFRMEGDVDNIIKPVLDALKQHIYVDDRQVERVWVQKFEPGTASEFASPSPVLVEAIQGDKPLLYIRLSDDPSEGLRHAFVQ